MEKKLIADLVSSTRGVYEVDNQISVEISNKISDEQISNSIQDFMAKNEFISLEGVKLDIDNGHVMLDGQVDSAYEYQAIKELISYIEGVKNISDNLEISY